jgi:Domain of unknown function (DUF4843)
MRIRTWFKILDTKIERIMKRIKNLLLVIPVLLFAMSSCIENPPVVYTGSVAEFDATVWNAPATGVTYPILTRVAGYGRAVSTTTDPLITRTSGAIKFRVNLVSAQFAADQVLNVSVVADKTTAISGTHYTVPATVTIPANSSFGEVTVTVLNPGATSGSVDLVLQIDGNETVKPNENFKKLGIRIAQN